MRILSLDVGDKTIGVAVSDPDGIIASPVTTVKRGRNIEKDITEVISIADSYNAGKIVVGLPLSLGNRETEQTKKVVDFTDKLKESTKIPVVYYDERFTTKIAHSVLHEAGIKNRHHKKMIDRISAVIILEDFLELQRGPN
ncbi:MAG: Holliday junction resolvase RuvX [Epsilonproteobacteria bacterium]|nr:Holliday junction resolvase RuvX [Campylobacterota bacterium]